jgi:hypothetical protein
MAGHVDKYVDYREAANVLQSDFKNEKALCDYIETNMHLFCDELLGVELKSYKREYRIAFKSYRGNRSQRIDFYIESKCGQRIVLECKNPTYACELTAAVGQALGYKSLMKQYGTAVDRTVIVTTKLDTVAVMVIQDNNLPIELIAMDKTKSLTLCAYTKNVN